MTTSSVSVLRAIVASLEDDPVALGSLAELLAPFLGPTLRPDDVERGDEWLSTKRAADYLGMTTGALYKLTAARTIPFEQDGPGCKCWFRRSELDRWRQAGGQNGGAGPHGGHG